MTKTGCLSLRITCLLFMFITTLSYAKEVCQQFSRDGKCLSWGNQPTSLQQNNSGCGSSNPKAICAQSYNNWIYQKKSSTATNVILKCIHNGKYVATCVTSPIDSSTIQTSNPDTPNGPTSLYNATLYQSREACTAYYYWCNPNLSANGIPSVDSSSVKIPIIP